MWISTFLAGVGATGGAALLEAAALLPPLALGAAFDCLGAGAGGGALLPPPLLFLALLWVFLADAADFVLCEDTLWMEEWFEGKFYVNSGSCDSEKTKDLEGNHWDVT